MNSTLKLQKLKEYLVMLHYLMKKYMFGEDTLVIGQGP